MQSIPQEIQEHVNAWVLTLSAQGVSKHTLRAYKHDVIDFVEHVKLTSIDDFKMCRFTKIQPWLMRHLHPRTVSRSLAALRSFVKHMGWVNHALVQIRGPKKPQTLPRALTQSQVDILFEKLDDIAAQSWVGQRDRALFLMIYSVGLRISEALNLKWSDISETSMRFIGKRQKLREVPLLANVKQALVSYKSASPYRSSAYVFLGARGGQMAVSVADRVLQNLRTQLGLPDTLTPHALRHTCATHLLASSGQLRMIQELLGHASLTSTQVYTQVCRDQLWQNYKDFHPRANVLKTKND